MRRPAFFDSFKSFLQQGTTPEALAASSTIGLLMGIFPVLGVTTIMMGGISVKWRLNLPLMLALSYLVYPLQILLLIPFVRLGEWMTGAESVKLSFSALGESFSKNFSATLIDLGAANLQALLGWVVLALPFGLLMFLLMKPIFSLVLKRRQQT